MASVHEEFRLFFILATPLPRLYQTLALRPVSFHKK
jgi:hypothetical protein